MKRFFALAMTGIVLLSGCQNKVVEPQETNKLNEEKIIIEESSSPISTEIPIKQRSNVDFRNAKWGENMETVKKYELDITLSDSEDMLSGEVNVGGYESYVGFLFDDNKLYEGVYAFPLDYSNSGQYIPAYDTLKSMLTQKYGDPYEDEIIPLTKQSLIDYAGPASSLEYGYVVYRCQWETNTTNILLGMSAENYEVKLLILYTDKNYEADINDSGL